MPRFASGVAALCGWALWLLASSTAVQAAQSRAAVEPQQIREAVRRRIESAGSEPLAVAGEVVLASRAIRTFYLERDHQPLWTTEAALTAGLPASMLAAIRAAGEHGLTPGRYHAQPIERLLSSSEMDATERAGLELLLTDAFIAQVVHRSAGVLDPITVDDEWRIGRAEADPQALLRELSGGAAPQALLDGLWPASPDYGVLLAEKRRLRSAAEAETVRITDGPTLRLGQMDPRVPLLRERLGLAPQSGTAFDPALRDAVIDFQRGAGLEPDGVVGANTRLVLNRSRGERIAALDANMERMRWLPRRRPDEYIRINIADYQLVYERGGEHLLRMDVIVGKPYRRTPVFTAAMKYVVFNPEWHVPRKIAVQDKLPLLRADAAAQAALGYEVAPVAAPGEFVSVADVDWSRVKGFPFTLRQRPGPVNALGEVKLMMPNEHAVYLHDTPNRELFAKTERSFSSGCIRLAKPLDLAELVLRSQPGWTRARIDAAVEGERTQTAYLSQPLPVYFLYHTAFVDDGGRVRYRRDIYDRDRAVVTALESS